MPILLCFFLFVTFFALRALQHLCIVQKFEFLSFYVICYTGWWSPVWTWRQRGSRWKSWLLSWEQWASLRSRATSDPSQRSLITLCSSSSSSSLRSTLPSWNIDQAGPQTDVLGQPWDGQRNILFTVCAVFKHYTVLYIMLYTLIHAV